MYFGILVGKSCLLAWNSNIAAGNVVMMFCCTITGGKIYTHNGTGVYSHVLYAFCLLIIGGQ